ncbi:PhzF family phenazine biosynthesis protein [Vibrio sp. SCSIO 43137]|uniref:PhzF family phenazine biosynthesis protein n=1 Tax=Vibrio sp. SCSIO 43137 TaxID=3021011 RepID=UPI002307E5CE|nr:PhzF family phenazine biosynthesis protein [Vibrio sp. SCSIO 43137]WCE31763.1 PhzF family phenazine biosynthesis protein [Vibrio sp. SCSIO 43137]
MDLEIYQIDSFTTEAFKGNPAGVCITESGLSESLMLSIAEEMAVSETAFLSLSDMSLRWFTPESEVKLCGHGTLAVAHVLKEKGLASSGDSVKFKTLSGTLTALINESTVELDFPSPVIDFALPQSPELLAQLGIEVSKVVSYGSFDSKVLIEVYSEDTLLDLKPNFEAMKQTKGRGVLITTQSASGELDFVSRYFAPWVGVNEDPVTGSAHCALTVYWSEKLGKSKLQGYQASKRGGYVATELLSNGRTKLIGSAVTVVKGVMRVPFL